jgi:hypothetical protein
MRWRFHPRKPLRQPTAYLFQRGATHQVKRAHADDIAMCLGIFYAP